MPLSQSSCRNPDHSPVDDDPRYHLIGVTRLLDSISCFASTGGLLEAASWTVLRQQAFIAFYKQEPLTIHLANYRRSSSFVQTHEEAWLNRMIFIFASVLSACFSKSSLNEDRWSQLEGQTEDWMVAKPAAFDPLLDDLPDGGSKNPWPLIYMSHPVHVVALQYYHWTKLTLSAYNPHVPKIGLRFRQTRLSIESDVQHHMRRMIGLAVHHKSVLNAQFQLIHVLSACGSYLTRDNERRAALTALQETSDRIGWPTKRVQKQLRDEWLFNDDE
ncbi:hypothetical protein K461DRAFT_163107 [Myriangium duriaei CBS 260.36]|uniref:Transcription factor domain-containing protein n=1 Tax=Myriangium duriaei CBS 260.36 TaxID=1168546 RepID=A0A9P4MGH4_9PEZI|nr:hypothetical protein K461DRAFT_163107 [Myriangium duriaei CBS 260.36]